MEMEPIRLAILAYPGAQTAAVHGLRDLLETADRLARETAPRPLAVEVLAPAPGEAPAWDAPLAALVLPPCLGFDPGSGTGGQALQAWIHRRHAEGALVCSVCAGAFLLAETGLLDGRPATTHWALREAFAARFPQVGLDTDRLLIDDGDLMTAGGLMAWVDLGLRLVHRFLGTQALLATSRHFLVDPGEREQRFYTTFAPSLTHGDAPILRVQHWLQRVAADPVTVPDMAQEAHLSPRTFLRRFQRATGLTPTDYLQHLRIGRARELLEQSDLSLDEIAWDVGYRDTGAFRKVFQRLMGLTPGAYRHRFRIRR